MKEYNRLLRRAKEDPSTEIPDKPKLKHYMVSDFTIEASADVFEDDPRGTIIHIDELAGLTIELGRGKNYSINDLVDMFGEDYPREYIDKRPGEMRSTLCDLGLAFSVVGYQPTRELKDYIDEVKNG